MPALPAAELPSTRDLRIGVVGDLVADVYVSGRTDRVSREAPVVVVKHETTRTVPGGAANVVANVAALGARVSVVGVVGRDEAGDALTREFKRIGVDVKGLLVDRVRPTETKTRVLAGAKGTTLQQVLRLDRRADEPLSDGTRKRLLGAVARLVKSCDAIVVSDYGGGLFDETVIASLRTASKSVPVLVDARAGLERFSGFTLLKPNEPELEGAVGKSIRGPSELVAAARTLLRKLKPSMLVVTQGREGMSLFRPGTTPLHVDAFGPKEAVDVTGAGDTVIATLATFLARGLDPERVLELANVAGAVVVGKPGTATCTHAELARALAEGLS